MQFKIIFLCLVSSACANDLFNHRQAHKRDSKAEFVIFIPSYNNEKYAAENLRSVAAQKSSLPYEIICVNDCSKDNTGEMMEEFVAEHKLTNVTIIHNSVRVGMLANTYNVINTLPDHKIVVVVDGDDKLPFNEVLLRLEQEYEDPDTWLTYGQSITIPWGKLVHRKIPNKIFQKRTLRQYHDVSVAALRTFRAGLFKKIKKDDLLYKGKFFAMSGDEAYMYPMFEMCCPQKDSEKCHAKFIPDVLYFYNVSNPISDARVNEGLQAQLTQEVRSRKPYKPIKHWSNEGAL